MVSDEYKEDAERIDEEYIPADATTEQDVEDALREAGFPQAAQSDIQSWLVDESDAWDTVGPQTERARDVAAELERASDGTVNDARADQIAEQVAGEINRARSQVAQNVDPETGQIRAQNGGFGPKLSNAEEIVRNDGIYYRAQDSGKEFKGASFDR